MIPHASVLVFALCAGCDGLCARDFVAGSPTTSNSSLVANPNYAVADNTATLNIVCTLRDAHGNVVPNTTVTFSASGTNTTLTPSTAATDANGRISMTAKSSTVQTETISASNGNMTLTTTVMFTTGPPYAATSSLSVSPNAQPADGSSAIVATAVFRDAQSRAIANQSVTFSSAGAAVTAAPTSAATDDQEMRTPASPRRPGRTPP